MQQSLLSKRELIGFKIRINLRKQKHYILKDPISGELQKDPAKLGEFVEFLPGCLNPELTEAQRKDGETMAQRFLPDHGEIAPLSTCDMTSDDLAVNCPVYYHFYPSQETLRKLCLRMVQV